MRLDSIDWTYINLDHRDDRDRITREQLAGVGISAARFPAMTCDEYDARDAAFLRFPNTGTVGCAMSHMALLKEAATRGDGILGILEDDVLFCDDFNDRMKMVAEQFREPWDIFFLNATFHLRPTWHRDTLGKDFELTDTRHIVRVYGLWCTHSYLVNCNSAEKILDVLADTIPVSNAIDHALILSQPRLRCYCFVPGMTAQFDNFSDITNSDSAYSGFFPHGPYVFCRRLDEFDYGHFLELIDSEYSPN